MDEELTGKESGIEDGIEESEENKLIEEGKEDTEEDFDDEKFIEKILTEAEKQTKEESSQITKKDEDGKKTGRHLHAVKHEPPPKKKDEWLIPDIYLKEPYVNLKEAGRGLIQCGKDLTNIVIRYYQHDKERFEKVRHFAEVQIGSSEKFIIDGVELEPLVQRITEDIWDIVEARRIMRQAMMGLKRIK